MRIERNYRTAMVGILVAYVLVPAAVGAWLATPAAKERQEQRAAEFRKLEAAADPVSGY